MAVMVLDEKEPILFEKDKQQVIGISRASGHRSNILPSHSAALGSNLDAPEMAAGVA